MGAVTVSADQPGLRRQAEQDLRDGNFREAFDFGFEIYFQIMKFIVCIIQQIEVTIGLKQVEILRNNQMALEVDLHVDGFQ